MGRNATFSPLEGQGPPHSRRLPSPYPSGHLYSFRASRWRVPSRRCASRLPCPRFSGHRAAPSPSRGPGNASPPSVPKVRVPAAASKSSIVPVNNFTRGFWAAFFSVPAIAFLAGWGWGAIFPWHTHPQRSRGRTTPLRVLGTGFSSSSSIGG